MNDSLSSRNDINYIDNFYCAILQTSQSFTCFSENERLAFLQPRY